MSTPADEASLAPGYTHRRTMSFLRSVAFALLVVLAGTAPLAVLCALACAAPAAESAEHSGHHGAHHAESAAATEPGTGDSLIAGTAPCAHDDAAIAAVLTGNFRLLPVATVSSAPVAPLLIGATVPMDRPGVTAHGPPGSPTRIPLRI